MPDSRSAPDIAGILKVLARHGVQFIVVGGVAATLQGAPISTYDVDIVHARDEPNVNRLLAALAELEAVYRMQPNRPLVPNATHLAGTGHNLLLTRLGPLDVLGAIGKGHTWDHLIAKAENLTMRAGFTIAVLDLPTQIAIKEEVAGEKDALMLPILRRTLAERSR